MGGGIDPLIGNEVDGYVLEDRLGAGGMGVVYRAFDRGLNRHVALKLLAPHLTSDGNARRRFQKEITAAAAVDHPNIVPVYNAGVDGDGNFFIVMRLIEGQDLGDLVRDGPLDLGRALRLTAQVAAGLQKVHSSGLVHRDVKPQNILIWNAGGPGELALLTDFGIAKAMDSESALTLGVPGTPEYVAPEVAQWHQATPASDQYSLACVLFRLLAGEGLFEGHELPRAHIDEPLPDLEQRLPQVPRTVQSALARGLSKDPEERFPSVEAFAEAMMVEEAQPDQHGKARRLSPHAEIAAVLEELSGEWVDADRIALLINTQRVRDRREPVTPLQIEARVRAYPQLFRRRGQLIQLRHPGQPG